MKTLGILVTALVLLVVGTMAGQDQPSPPQDEKLRQELLERVERDQAARKSVTQMLQMNIELWQKSRKSKKELSRTLKIVERSQADIRKLMEINRQNTDWLKEIVEKYGWPGKTLVGEDGAHSARVLVDGAYHDIAFQKKCLDLMKEAVTKKEASHQDFAYLTDRVLIADKKKQLYGTQLTQDGDKLVPQPIEDEEHVDERRKEIGLQPLAEYLESAQGELLPKKEEKGE